MEHLARLLLDFGRAPGNYPVRLREPRVLFDEFDVIAQWALNRLPESLQDRATDLKAAAVLFIQRACFASDNTYYQVLGLQPRAYSPEELRARYRTMIRLAHPDMGLKGLPANAASLVNQANKVLSDSAQRLQYDEQLSRQKVAHTVTPTPVLSQVRVVPNHHGIAAWLQLFKAQHPRILRAFALFGSVSIPVAAVLIWAAQESNDSRMLVMATQEPVDRPAMAMHQIAETASSLKGSNLSPQSGDTVTTRISAAEKPAVLENTPVVATGLPQALIQGSEIAQNRIAKSELPASPAQEIVVTPSLERPQAVSVAVQPATVASSAPVNAPSAGLAALPNVAVQSSGNPPVAVIPVSTATPASQRVVPTQQPTLPVWNVDAEGARMYLNELMTRLENPSEAQRINAYLKSMKVKGSLLTPALKALSERSDFQVRPSHWTESTKSGTLNVQATVLVQPRVQEKDSVQVLQFRVLAEFHGTAEGTMLAVLDFKESN